MFRARLAAVSALALLAVSFTAHAAGISLSWNRCPGGIEAAYDLQFACDTNDRGSPFRLVAAVVPDVDIPGVVGVETILTIKFSREFVPDWWALTAGGCRVGAMTQEAPLAASAGAGCSQWLGAGLSTGVLFPKTITGGLQITAEWDNAGGVTTAVTSGTRYVANLFDVDQTRTVALAPVDVACSGCSDQATVSLFWVRLLRASDSWTFLIPDGSNVVTWQGPAVATRNSSWGAIKALYR